MWASIFGEINFFQNFNFSFSTNNSDIILHLTHWQYWFWFWFTFFLVLYYLLFLKLIRSRGVFHKPRLMTSLKSHGKWGDILVCFVPIGWCTNILTNSNFILRMIEWQSESVNFTLRVRGKQWYWVYKFDVQNYQLLLNSLKKLGHGVWFRSVYQWNSNYLLLLRDLTSLEKNYFIWNNSILDVCEFNFGNQTFRKNYGYESSLFFQTIFTQNILNEGVISFTTKGVLHAGRTVSTPITFLINQDYGNVFRVDRNPSFIYDSSLLEDNLYFSKFHKAPLEYTNSGLTEDDLQKREQLLELINGGSAKSLKNVTVTPSNSSTPSGSKGEPTEGVVENQEAVETEVLSVEAVNKQLLNKYTTAWELYRPSIFKKIKSLQFQSFMVFSGGSFSSNVEYITRLNKEVNFYKPLNLVQSNNLLSFTTTYPFLNKPKFQPVSMFLVIKQKRFEMQQYFITNLLLNKSKIDLFNGGTKPMNLFFNSKKLYDPSLTSLSNRRLLRTKRILILPVGTNMNIITNSFDVIHSWFIPGLGVKLDCVPGRSTHHYLNIDHVGFYYGQCAEICGRFHHHMPIRICALPYEHFILWWYNYGAPYFFIDAKYRYKVRKPLIRALNF